VAATLQGSCDALVANNREKAQQLVTVRSASWLQPREFVKSATLMFP